MLREQQILDEVEIILPASDTARFRLHGQSLVDGTASCYVVRGDGDSPGSERGEKVHASIRVEFFTPRRIVLDEGPCTASGASGEASTGPCPKPLVLEVVREIFAMRCIPATLTVTVGAPERGLAEAA
jgi:cobalt-precorrin-5B (C1)-methyltransferase